MLNSRMGPFTAPALRRDPFSRSYGARLPSSLTRFHSRALVYSTHPPVSVYGTGSLAYAEDFLGTSFKKIALAVASAPPLSIGVISPDMRPFSLRFGSSGILNLMSIVYAHRPRLRSRLTLGGRTFPRKPWVYGGQEFNLAYRYSCLHSHLLALHSWLPSCFDAPTTLPYHSTGTNPDEIQSFGIPLIANHFRREITR